MPTTESPASEAAPAPPATSVPFDSSPSIAHLAEALSKAQGEFPILEKNKTANIRAEGSSFAFDYADLARVVGAVMPVASRHGLAISQFPGRDARGAVIVTTVIMHTSGEWIAATLDWPVAKQDARGIGSAITYARRYGLSSLAGVAASDEDDDGAAASERPRGKKKGEAYAADPNDERPITTTNRDGGPGGQLGRLRAIMREHGVDEKAFGAYLKETYGYQKWGDIQRRHYDAIVSLAQDWSSRAEGQ